MLLTCDSFLIDDEVLAIEPFFIGEMRSKITRIDGIYYSKESPISLLEKACLRYGSTTEGRVNAVKEKMSYMHKTPLIVIPFSVGAFPTVSSENLSCVWIFNHPFKVEELEKGKSAVTLLNGKTIIVPVSKHSLSNQQNKLHSALNMFEKFQKTQQFIYESSRKSMEKKDIATDRERPNQVAETYMHYKWKKKKDEQ